MMGIFEREKIFLKNEATELLTYTPFTAFLSSCTCNVLSENTGDFNQFQIISLNDRPACADYC